MFTLGSYNCNVFGSGLDITGIGWTVWSVPFIADKPRLLSPTKKSQLQTLAGPMGGGGGGGGGLASPLGLI